MMTRLIIFFVVGLLCLDTDEFAFAIKYLRGYPAPFSVATYGMVADRLYKLVVFLAAGGAVAAFFLDVAQSTRRRLIGAGSMAFYLCASARMIVDGYGPLSPFLNEARGFMIFAGAIATGLMLAKDDERLREATMAFQGVIAGKALVSLALYAWVGGVPLVADVPSVEIDGGFLMLCLVSAALALCRLLHAAKPMDRVISVISLMLCLAVIVGSYRRLVVIYCALVFAGWMVPRWIQNRGWFVGGASALIAVMAVTASGFAIYAGWFGWEAATGRLQSLLMTEGGDGQQALSSEMYLDDWRAWCELMREHWLSGIGFRNQVTFHGRLTDAVFGGDGGRVSLHTGAYELWIRMGIVGAAYHAVFFGLVPLALIGRAAAIKSPASHDLVLMGCAILLVFGFFPYSGFNHYTQAFALSSGFLLGTAVALARAAEADGLVRGSRWRSDDAITPARVMQRQG